MPWRKVFPEDQRVQFIVEALHGPSSVADLCRSFGISCKTGFKWLARYDAQGPSGLLDQSRAPHGNSNAIVPEIAEKFIALRKLHPTWGPRKLLAWVHSAEPHLDLPAPSTVGALLKRLNLVRVRRRRSRAPAMTVPFGACETPNDTWCTDFKGHFLVRDGSRCDPLTLTDAYSRFLLRCDIVPGTSAVDVRPSFESAFREFGLPRAIRSDNGPPFASVGAGGLTRLSIWWIHLGIQPERIEPGRPEQNGRHERMHRTLKEETARPPRQTLRAQQLAFDRFRKIYNEERPHEALENNTPASAYEPSLRRMPSCLPELEYPGHFELRSVHHAGYIKWKGRILLIGKALHNEVVGLEEVADATYAVRLGPVELGRIKDDLPHLGLIRPRSARRR
jgi:transposase InsO family protein